MKDFIAIDFETANHKNSSVCAVGLVVVRDGEVTDEYYSLILPEPNYYEYRNMRIHGLSRADTDAAPIFPDVWDEIEPLLDEDLPFVAHGSSNDERFLRAAFRVYQMDYPDFQFVDTHHPARRAFPHLPNHQLQTVAEACGFHLEHHHNALADAHAAAAIALYFDEHGLSMESSAREEHLIEVDTSEYMRSSTSISTSTLHDLCNIRKASRNR